MWIAIFALTLAIAISFGVASVRCSTLNLSLVSTYKKPTTPSLSIVVVVTALWLFPHRQPPALDAIQPELLDGCGFGRFSSRASTVPR